MERYRAIVEHAPEALCVVQEGRVAFLNPKACELLGVGIEEPGGLLLHDFVHPEDLPLLGGQEGQEQGSQRGPGAVRIMSPSGNVSWVRITGVPMTWDGSEAVLYGFSDFTEQRRLEEDLRASEERYRTAIENANDGVAMVRGQVHIYVNQRFLDIFGYERPEEVVGKPITMMVHPDDRERVMEFNLRRQRGEPAPSRYEFKGIRENGAPIYVEVSATRTTYRGEAVSLVYVRDVTERKWFEEALQRSRDFYLTLFEEFPTMIWRLGVDGRCDYLNRAWLEFTGRPLEEEIGEGWLQAIHPEDVEQFKGVLQDAFSKREPFSVECRALRRDGAWRWVLNIGRPFRGLDGDFAGYIGASYDITERKEHEEELQVRATHDPLTALPNRRLLEDRLHVALAQAARKQGCVAVIMVDLDKFKDINDRMGHMAGDELLVELGGRLKGIIRAGDTAARIGGDEFVVVLPDISTRRNAQRVARRLLNAFREPFRIQGEEVRITPSLGMAIFPDHGGSPDILLQKADQALYRAKAQGGNRAALFKPA